MEMEWEEASNLMMLHDAIKRWRFNRNGEDSNYARYSEYLMPTESPKLQDCIKMALVEWQ